MEFFASTVIILGLGICDQHGDYCPDPVGEIRVEQSIVEGERSSIWTTATHLSRVGNGEPTGGDRGSNFLMLEYRYKLR